MKIPRGTRSDIGFQTTSNRVVDDPHNYAKEFPVRKTRNPKPQYKMSLEPLSLPATARPRSTGRGAKPKKVLTPRRKAIISTFIRECSANPSKYGRIGSIPWIDELASQINTPGTGRGSGTVKGPVGHSDVLIWLDHADIVDLYENLKRKQRRQQLESAQPIAGTSGGVTKDKNHVAPLPPKKRVRISSPSTWEFISPSNSPSSSSPGFLAGEKDPLSIDDGDTRSSTTGPPNGTSSDEHPVPAQSSSSCYTSSLNAIGEAKENSPVRVTVVKKSLSDDDLLAEAAAVAEELTASSVVNQPMADAELSDELVNPTIEPVKKEEYILPSVGNLESQDGQQNTDQDQSLGIHNSGQEGRITTYESIDFRVQRDAQPTFPMQGMIPVALAHQGPLGAANYNGILPITQSQQVQWRSVNFRSAIPTPSPDLPSFGALNLVQHQGRIPPQSRSNSATCEERRLGTLKQALGNLHNCIDSVREAYNGLDTLNYQSRAPSGMRVFGFILDSMISFYTNYMRPDEQ